MKKYFLLIFILSLSILITGCGKKDPDIYKITVLDNSASTGNVWKHKLTPNFVVSVKEDIDYSNCPKKYTGCNAYHHYYLKPIRKGKTTLKLELISNKKEVLETIVYNIEVDKNLKITETHDGDLLNFAIYN